MNTTTRKKPGPKTEVGDDDLVPITVKVDKRTLELLEVLSPGNRSRGVREAVRTAYDRYQRTL